MKIGDDRARRFDPLAAREYDAFGGAVLRHDALYRRAEPNFAAGGGDRARQSGDDDVGAATPQRHAERLISHTLQIRKQRTARGVRREIEMHAPDRHHGLELGVFEILVEPIAR